MTSRDPKHAFTSRPRDVETWVRASDVTTQKNGAKAHHFTARLTIDVTPDLRGRIKVQPSGAESPSPKCFAICSLASFLPIPGAPHERTHACRAPVDQEAGREPNPLRSKRRSTHHRPPVARRLL